MFIRFSICSRGETDIINAFEAFVPGSSPGGSTRIELDGFLEAKIRDARSASQGFPPNFPNEFSIFGALALRKKLLQIRILC